jgi:hypothetical protein
MMLASLGLPVLAAGSVTVASCVRMKSARSRRGALQATSCCRYPGIDCDSMCSTSFTVVVNARSVTVMMRFSDATYALRCMTSAGFCAERAGGAMNSGPTGLATDSRIISSIALIAAASNFLPMAPATAPSCAGWRAPQSATVTKG